MINIQGKKIKLTKIKSLRYLDNDHPGNINEGYEKIGYAINDIEVGDFLTVACNYKVMHTTTVLKINNDQTFETKNSVYKYELLPETPQVEIGKKYDHYKGGYYEVIAIGIHTETKEELVVYNSLIHGTTHCRPITQWFEPIHMDGKTRFTLSDKQ